MSDLTSPGSMKALVSPLWHGFTCLSSQSIAFLYSFISVSHSFAAKSSSGGNLSFGMKYWQGGGKLAHYYQIKYLCLRLRDEHYAMVHIKFRGNFERRKSPCFTLIYDLWAMEEKCSIGSLSSYYFLSSTAPPPSLLQQPLTHL